MLLVQAYLDAVLPIKQLLYEASVQEAQADYWISNLPLEKAQTLWLRKDALIGVRIVGVKSCMTSRWCLVLVLMQLVS